MRSILSGLLAFLFLALPHAQAQEKPLPQDWDYAAAMKKVAGRFQGNPGVVLHVGDSITYSNPYGQWARHGQGQTEEDKAVLKWMHKDAGNDSDGWYLARFDHPAGGRSYTACGGIRADEMLKGGTREMPPLSKILDTYKPQLVVLMLGTNDASANRPVNAYSADMEKALQEMLKRGIVLILSTIPPHHAKPDLARQYNEALRQLARKLEVPLIDYEKEILKRRPDDWNGTLLGKNDVHPTAAQGDINAASAPTAENLRSCGYLLRGWLSVKKIAEVKRTVLDARPGSGTAPPPPPDPGGTPKPAVPKPQGESLRLPVTRDNWFSNVGGEVDGNNGGATRLKLKSNQEMSLVDLDPAALKGRVIQGATLHVRLAGSERLHRVTVSSFGSEWVEGTASGYQPQKGSSTHKHRRHPDELWAGPGSDLCSVMLGEGGTLWRMADALPPDEQGWQKIAVDPLVVAARSAGISHGFLVFDDTGSEWTRDGEKFTLKHFPNRFVHSRESGKANAPYFTVWLGAEDREAPPAPTGLESSCDGLPAGETSLSWVMPHDKGPAGTIGFFVRVDGKDAPRYLVPVAGKPGERVRMRLRDLNLPAGKSAEVEVSAVDGAGNRGEPARASLRVSDSKPIALPGKAGVPFTDGGALPRLGKAEVAILDELDKVQPVTGAMIPAQADGYLAANHLWSARERQVRLQGGRNEFLAFQILVRGEVKGAQPRLEFEGPKGAKVQATFGRYVHVPTRVGPLPDPIVPLLGGLDVPSTDEKIEGQKSGSLHCEVYIPHEATAGRHEGKLVLESAGQSLELKVNLQVWDFTLPDYLSFLPEMNCYGLPANERDYYRQAHRHRTVLNRVPYHQSGSVAPGCAPRWDGKTLDWAGWGARFGPYLDGTAFADLPRKGVPIECFYLPLNENWPGPMEGNYNGNYWADRAFPARYRQDFVEVSRQFTTHLDERKYQDTLFHFFLNGKNNFKQKGWSLGSSPWLLDEPSNYQDYWALRWYGAAFHEGVNKARAKGEPGASATGGKKTPPPDGGGSPGARMAFRADISRPQWQRNTFDGLLDYNVVGGLLRNYHRLVMDRKEQFGEITVEYGGTNALDQSNLQPVGWSLDAWSIGTDGVLPWQTVGRANSWQEADTLALFYPGRAQGEGVVPSVRLKAYRRGQQDVEYLTLLTQQLKQPRWATGQALRQALQLVAQREGTGGGAEDAGRLSYGKLLPQQVWALRVQIGEALSAAKPEAKRKLVDFRTPRRAPGKGDLGYVSVGEVP